MPKTKSSIQDLVITSLETITAFDVENGTYLFTLDELQKGSIGQEEDVTDLTGKMGRKISTLKRNKAVNISADNGMVSGGLFEVQTGSDFEVKETTVLHADYLTVKTQSATTTWKAAGTAGAEIKDIYIRNEDGSLGAKLDQAEGASSGKFAYDPESKKITFHTDVEDGTEVLVHYNRKISANVLENYSDKYARKCSLYIDAYAEDKCGKVFRVQIYVPKADVSGVFTLDMGDSQTIHSFSAMALAGACGTAGGFFTYTVFGEETPDVV